MLEGIHSKGDLEKRFGSCKTMIKCFQSLNLRKTKLTVTIFVQNDLIPIVSSTIKAYLVGEGKRYIERLDDKKLHSSPRKRLRSILPRKSSPCKREERIFNERRRSKHGGKGSRTKRS